VDPPAPEIVEAVAEAVKAGVFVRAGRLNPRFAVMYLGLARPHSERVTLLLKQAMGRLGV
jgi:hypothetical protein